METKGMGLWEQIPNLQELDFTPLKENRFMSYFDSIISWGSKQKHGEFFYLFPRVPQLSRNTWYRLKGKNVAIERRKAEELYKTHKRGRI